MYTKSRKRKSSQVFGSYAFSRKRRKFTGSMKSASQASRALRMIKKMQKDEEVKNIDLTGSPVLATASDKTWVALARVLLNGVAQGPGSTQRIGNKITLKNLLFRFVINGSDVNVNGVLYRVVIFSDRKPAGAAPAATDVFQTDSFLSPLAKKSVGRFAILHDEVITHDINIFKSMRKFYIPLTRVQKGDYSRANAGDVSDISKGALYIWVATYNANSADETYTYHSRVTFTDA